MGKRRRSRETALQALYQLDLTKEDAKKVLRQFLEHFLVEKENDAFIERLVLGVLEHDQEIDQLIKELSEHWRLDRMTIIDRNILRMAIFELLYCDDIPPKVTLNEAIDLGKRYGSKESGSFINGILDRVMNETLKKSKKPVVLKD